MEILVCVKQVLDARLPIVVTEGGDVLQKEATSVYVLNPSDRCAVEEAIRLRDAAGSCRVTAMTVGPAAAKMVLGQCLARGVDTAVHLLSGDSASLDSFAVAQALCREIKTRNFDLILCGERSLDEGASEVGVILAEMLDIPQVTSAVKLNVWREEGRVVAERRLERGYRQVVETALPALVSVDVSICEPRYMTSRAIRCGAAMLAEKCKVVNVSSGGGDNTFELRKVAAKTPPRPRPKKIVNADEGKSAADRIAAMLGGGFGPAKAAKSSNEPKQGPADEIIAFLKEKGLLS